MRFRRRQDVQPDAADVEAPGWDAIDAALAKLYPGIEPIHVAPGVGPYLGGGVQGISAYPAEGHWHLVTYGLSELYAKETANPDESGFGYELTFRIPRFEGEMRPPDWPFVLLERVALTQREGTDYWAGSRVHVGGPINGEASPLEVLAFTPDSQLGTIETPNGRLEFLQLVGVTEEQWEQMKRTTTADVLGVAAADNSLLVGPQTGGRDRDPRSRDLCRCARSVGRADCDCGGAQLLLGLVLFVLLLREYRSFDDGLAMPFAIVFALTAIGAATNAFERR